MVPRILITVLALALLSGVAAAQYCYAENPGNVYNPAVSTGGVLIGIKFTAPANLLVSGIDMFTGNVPGTNTVAIWTHNALQNQPGTSLGTGSWTMITTPSWQGATLPSPISLSSGVIYWVVWGGPGGCLASLDMPGPNVVLQTYRGSFDNGQSWNGPWLFNDRPWKFRFTCFSLAWQVNQPLASLTVNGVQSTGVQPAISPVTAGLPVPVSFGGLAGAPWDMGYTVNASLMPSAFTTAHGQVVNLDFMSPSFGWSFGGLFLNAFAPTTTLHIFPVPGMEIDAQLVIITPTTADGFSLSQAVGVQTL